MNIINTIIEFGSEIALVLRVISLFICVIFVLRLQIKEVYVRNGLIRLRMILLGIGASLSLVHILTIIFLIDLIVNNVSQRPYIVFLQIVNSIAFLLITYLWYLVYHTQYSSESKKMHADYERKCLRKSCPKEKKKI